MSSPFLNLAVLPKLAPIIRQPEGPMQDWTWPPRKRQRIRISNSMLQQFHSCPRKFEFQNLFWHPRRKGSLPAEAGQAMHNALETFVVTRDRDAAAWRLQRDYPWDLNSNWQNDRSAEACLATLDAMMNSYSFLNLEIAEVDCLDGTRRPAIEVPFEIVIKDFSLSDEFDLPVSFVGTIDAIFWDHIKGKFVVYDYKTTTWKYVDLNPLYEFSPQVTGYGLVLNHLIKGQLEEFEARYLVGKIDVLNPVVQPMHYTRTQADVTDWLQGLLLDLTSLKTMMSLQWFPRHGGNACMGFNQRCEFFDVCKGRDVKTIQHQLLFNQKPDESEYAEPWVKVELEMPKELVG